MFSRWGAFVYRFRRPIAVIMLGVAVVMASFATRAASGLSSGGWLDPGSESAQVADRLAAVSRRPRGGRRSGAIPGGAHLGARRARQGPACHRHHRLHRHG